MSDTYLLGRSTAESRRLTRQAALIEPETEDFFRRSGIAAGMKVLDLGSGEGDVAMLVGRLVNPGGSILGVEHSIESVTLASQRVAANHLAVRFEVGDLNSYEPKDTYDAVVGRFVLPYLDDPVATLRRVAAHVRPGGVIAMLEFDVRQIGGSPETPLLRTVAEWIVEANEKSGIDPGLGSSLGGLFREAGLPCPCVTAFQKASCGPNGITWYFAELVRTLLPRSMKWLRSNKSMLTASKPG
jgi:SAM-dependent methyltransferase